MRKSPRKTSHKCCSRQPPFLTTHSLIHNYVLLFVKKQDFALSSHFSPDAINLMLLRLTPTCCQASKEFWLVVAMLCQQWCLVEIVRNYFKAPTKDFYFSGIQALQPNWNEHVAQKADCVGTGKTKRLKKTLISSRLNFHQSFFHVFRW